jgi:hypothetical protein
LAAYVTDLCKARPPADLCRRMDELVARLEAAR